eukprot:COSAG02_NODE_428_length_22489_cov_4.690219_20_plen_78_part_00
MCIYCTYHNEFVGEMVFSWMFDGDYPLLKPMQGAAEILAARSVSRLLLHGCCKSVQLKVLICIDVAVMCRIGRHSTT